MSKGKSVIWKSVRLLCSNNRVTIQKSFYISAPFIFQIITDELKDLFNKTLQHITVLKPSDQQEVKLVEALLESDMRNLAEEMKKTLDGDISEVEL